MSRIIELGCIVIALSGCKTTLENQLRGTVGGGGSSFSLSTSKAQLHEGAQYTLTVEMESAPSRDTKVYWRSISQNNRLIPSQGELTFLKNQKTATLNLTAARNATLADDATVVVEFWSEKSNVRKQVSFDIQNDTQPARLILNSTSNLQFPLTASHGETTYTFVLSNQGDMPASLINAAAPLSPPFSYLGANQFPGPTSTCSTSLNPGTNCSFVVSFEPTTSGTHSGSIQLNLFDGTQSSSVQVNIQGQSTDILATLNNSPATFTASSNTDFVVSGTSVTHYQFAIGPGTLDCTTATYSATQPIATHITANSLSEGAKKLCVIGFNGQAWQPKTFATTHSWTIDATPPQMPSVSVGGQSLVYTNLTSVALSLQAIGGSEMYLTQDSSCASGGVWEAFATLKSVNLALDTSQQIYVVFRDEAFNLTSCQSVTIVQDQSVPAPPTALTLGSVPVGLTSSPTLSFTAATDGGPAGILRYETRLIRSSDSFAITTWQSTVSGQSLSSLSLVAGESYYFELVAVDRALNRSTAAVSSPFVAATALQAALGGTPSSVSSTTALNVNVSGLNVTQYKYKWGSSSIDCSSASGYSGTQAVASPITDSISAQADGGLKLCVVGSNGSDWQAYAAATVYAWTKDTISPTAILSTLSTSPTNDSPIIFTLQMSEPTSNAPVASDFIVNQASITQITTVSSSSFTIRLSPSANSVTVALQLKTSVLSDTAGNTNSPSNNLSVQYDGVLPSLTFTTPAPGSAITINNQSSFTFSGTCSENGRNVNLSGAVTQSVACASNLWTTNVDLSAASDGPITVVASHTKLSGSTATESLNLTKYPNRAPSLAAINNQSLSFSQALAAVNATDVNSSGDTDIDGQALTFQCFYDETIDSSVLSSQNCTDLAGLTFTPSTGILNWNPAEAGQYELKILASDGTLTDEKIFTVTVAAAIPYSGNICNQGQSGATRTLTDLSGTIYDSGGPSGIYSNGEGCVIDFNVSGTIDLTIQSYNTETNYDFLRVYQGSTTGTLLGTYHGSGGPVTLTTTGPFSIQFTSDGSVTGNGFEFRWAQRTPGPNATIALGAGQAGVTSSFPMLFDLTFDSDINTSTFTASDISQMGTATGVSWNVSWLSGNTYRIEAVSAVTQGTIQPFLGAGLVKDLSGYKNKASTSTAAVYYGNLLATLAAAPESPSADTNLKVSVTGNAVTHYKYKMGPAVSTTCTSSSGYSSAIATSTKITDSLTSYGPSQDMRLCVVGSYNNSIWQDFSVATEHNWQQDQWIELTAATPMVEALEGNSTTTRTFTFTTSMSAPSSFTVDYIISGSLSLAETSLRSGSFTFPAGTTAYNFTFDTYGNNLADGNRKITLHLTGSSRKFLSFANDDSASTLYVIDDETNSNNFSQIDTGLGHACAITPAQKLYCWGYNASGQVGDGTTTDRTTPTAIDSSTNYQAVSTGGYFTCGLTVGGTIKCWGANDYGQLGDGTNTNSLSPIVIDTGTAYKNLSMGVSFSCAITTADTLRCWGGNYAGQLGDSTMVSKVTPQTIDGGTTYSSVSAGTVHTCGITSSGSIKCWGNNANYQLGDGTSNNSYTPMIVDSGVNYSLINASREHTCGITTSGALKCWGANGYGQLGDSSYSTRSLPTVIDIASTYSYVHSSDYHTCAINSAQKIKCWGYNNLHQLGDFTTINRSTPATVDSSSSYTQVSGGDSFTCGLKADGTVKCWGSSLFAATAQGKKSVAPTPASILTELKFQKLATGPNSAAAISQSGSLYVWGSNMYSELGDGSTRQRHLPTLTNSGSSFIELALAERHGCGITSANVLRCWGQNTYGQIGDGTTLTALTSTVVDSGVSYTKVAVGQHHSCGITNAGVLKCWGSSGSGAVGTGLQLQYLAPTIIDSGTNYSEIAAGPYHTCGITTAGVLKCWGFNQYGELGDGTFTLRTSPVVISAGTTFTKVSANLYHSCAVQTDGVLKCWGLKQNGILGEQNTSSGTLPVTADSGTLYKTVTTGTNHTCGITQSDQIKCWGSNSGFQIGDGGSRISPRLIPTLINSGSTYKSVKAGDLHTCAITMSDDVQCWGWGASGTLGSGAIGILPSPIGL